MSGSTPSGVNVEPCPFCDHGAIVVMNRDRHPNDGEFDVECDNCGAAIRGESTLEQAVAAWNRRAPSSAVRERDALGAGLRAVGGLADTAAYNLHQTGISVETAEITRVFEEIARLALTPRSETEEG